MERFQQKSARNLLPLPWDAESAGGKREEENEKEEDSDVVSSKAISKEAHLRRMAEVAGRVSQPS